MRPWRHWYISLALLAGVTLLVFGHVLFSSRPLFLSDELGDIGGQYLDWRAFGFGELKQGRLPLWNPHLFGGAPFFGGFQSALLYPFNALFLVLPLREAINWTIVLHVYLAGVFTYAWTLRRGLWPPACFLAATIFMFGGAHVSHVYAGHLSNLCTLIWAPLLFLAIDMLLESPSARGVLAGACAAAMAVLAGHPQYVFYLSVAAALYSAMCVWHAKRPKAFVAHLCAMVLLAVGLSAVQLFTGWQESFELARQAVTYEFASQFSFPPENLVTLLGPYFFGTPANYWGRWYPWEMGIFIGVTALVLALVSVVACERRQARFSMAMAALLIVLALGAYTPIFRLLYDWVPGFGHFRGSAKFMVFASLFLAMAAACGLHALFSGRRPSRAAIVGVAAGGFVLLCGGFILRGATATTWWPALVQAIKDSGEAVYRSAASYSDPAFVNEAADMASHSLLVGGATLVAVALLLALLHRHRVVPWLLVGLAVTELVVFTRASIGSGEIHRPAVAMMQEALAPYPGDYRILNFVYPNAALSLGAHDVWGYDPSIVLRYARLVAASQGIAAANADQYIKFTRDHPLLSLLRCRFIVTARDGRPVFAERENYLPHMLLVSRHRVIKSRDDMLAALSNGAFDPRAEVLLEEDPIPAPIASADPGTVEHADESSDAITIDADVKSPSILLITDAYAAGWRVRSVEPGDTRTYRVMPADHGLRAIPLGAGRHRLRLEYLPSGFTVGKWISVASLAIFIGLLAIGWRPRSGAMRQ